MASKQPSEFSRRLTALRLKSGKSRYWMARYTGLTESYIYRLETGEKRNPSKEVVAKLCLALVAGCPDISIDEINGLRLAVELAPFWTRGDDFWQG